MFLFKFKGWKYDTRLPDGYERCVVIAAPHTSNWDFLYTMAAFYLIGIPIRYLAKKSLFTWPIKSMMFKTGGIPVERKIKGNLVDDMIGMFNNNQKLMLMIPAEGTRSKVKRWKTGFYHVAIGANVPILLGYLDYEKKMAGFGPLLYMTGDRLKDAEQIKDFYRNIKGKHPQNFDVNSLILS